MIIEACMWAIITATGVSPKSAPLHATETQGCLSSVNHYIASHCPITTPIHTDAEREFWAKIEAVSMSKAKTDAQALTAACP